MYDPKANPYVGPKPFAEEEWELFFGRRHETAALLSLVLRNRLVLFCAPSGAGKTSLLNTSLRRELGQQGFEVLPIARVSGDVPVGVSEAANIFAFNLILNLDGDQHPATALTQTRLAEYLEQTRPPVSADEQGSPTPYVLIIDQFEEIFISHPECWQQRGDFFEQLCEVMANDKLLWVVLAMRAEYIAGLDRYAPLVPGQLSTRFYMQGLEHDAALEAIEEPAKIGQRPFQPGVAQKLVDNLCLMKVRNHEVIAQPGEFVEPVQLQVVCQQLWEAIKDEPHATIRMADVERVAGDKGLAHFVDNALGRFFNEVVTKTVGASGIPELDLRRWIEEKLITLMDTRDLVQRGLDETEGIPNPVIDLLAQQLLIHRAEVRSGGVWYELIHDRLITPIRSSNLAWYQQHPLIQMAREWEQFGRSDDLLLEGQRLQAELRSDWQPLGSLVEEFLSESKALQDKKETERREAEQRKAMAHELELAKEAEERQRVEAEAARKLTKETEARRQVEAVARRKLRRRAIWLAVALVFALIAGSAAVIFAQLAWINWQEVAVKAAGLQSTMWLRDATDQLKAKPQRSLLLATEAVSQAPKDDGTFLDPSLLKPFYQVMMSTAGIPLRGQNDQLAVDITHLAVSDDGQWAAAGSMDGTVHVWNLANNSPERATTTLSAHNAAVTTIVFSPGEQWLATGGRDGVVNLFDLTALVVKPMTIRPGNETGGVLTVAFHPQDNWLAVGRAQGAVQRLELPAPDQPKLTQLLSDDSTDTATLAFSPNGTWLATVSRTDTLRLWPLKKLLPINEPRLLSEGKNGVIAFSPKGDWLAAASKGGDTAVHLFDVGNQDAPFVKLVDIEQGVGAISFSQDGEFLVVSSDNGLTRWWSMIDVVWDISAQSDQSKPTVPARPGSTSSPQISSISLNIDPVQVKAHDGPIRALAFGMQSVSGKRVSLLATAGADQAIRLWNNNELTAPQDELYGHDAEVTAVLFGPSPRLLLTASQDGTVRFWDLDEPRAPGDLTQLEAEELETWIAKACRRAGRDFSPTERELHSIDKEVPSACAKYLDTPGS